MRRTGLVVLAVAALAVSGCVPVGAPADPEPIELPPRPRDIDVREVDPCDLLTEAQRAEIGLERPPLLSPPDRSVLFEGPECTSRANEPRAFGVGVATPYDGLGIGALSGRPVRSELTVIDVQGFPAVLVRPGFDPLFCQVVVDTAPGSALNVQFRDGGRRNMLQDDLCEGAVQVANAAMTTLLPLS